MIVASTALNQCGADPVGERLPPLRLDQGRDSKPSVGASPAGSSEITPMWFYADLKAYKRDPCRRRKGQLRARFRPHLPPPHRVRDPRSAAARVCTPTRRSCWSCADRPELPLHTNGSERDLRPQVIKRKISGGTRADLGRACRDAFLGLLLTCAKLGLSFWDGLPNRLGVPNAEAPYLPDLVRLRSAYA